MNFSLLTKTNGRVTQFIILNISFHLDMSSINLTLNDDEINTDNETSPLVVHTQGTASSSPRYGPRHSTSWVNFLFRKFSKQY